MGCADPRAPRGPTCRRRPQGAALLRPVLGGRLRTRPRPGSTRATSRDREGGVAGEWTPGYMIDFWTPELIARAAPEARVLVLLRDPLERFRSGLTHTDDASRAALTHRDAAGAFQRGLYAQQLRRLFDAFPRERVLVQQYEACRTDPAPSSPDVLIPRIGGGHGRSRGVHPSGEPHHGPQDRAHARPSQRPSRRLCARASSSCGHCCPSSTTRSGPTAGDATGG